MSCPSSITRNGCPPVITLRQVLDDLFHPYQSISRYPLSVASSRGRTDPRSPRTSPETRQSRSCFEPATGQLAARTVEEVIVDQEQVTLPIPSMAPGAEQSKHGLARPRAADDQVLSFARQGAYILLLLAEILNTRQLELAFGIRRSASA